MHFHEGSLDNNFARPSTLTAAEASAVVVFIDDSGVDNNHF